MEQKVYFSGDNNKIVYGSLTRLITDPSLLETLILGIEGSRSNVFIKTIGNKVYYVINPSLRGFTNCVGYLNDSLAFTTDAYILITNDIITVRETSFLEIHDLMAATLQFSTRYATISVIKENSEVTIIKIGVNSIMLDTRFTDGNCETPNIENDEFMQSVFNGSFPTGIALHPVGFDEDEDEDDAHNDDEDDWN